MSWGKVKKINSDLSVPLNELIENKMRYVTSDNTLYVITNGVLITQHTEEELLTKTMKHPGVLDLRLTKDNDFSMYLHIYKNDELIIKRFCEDTISSVSVNFGFEKNDIIKIVVKGNYKVGDVTYMGLNGMVAFGDF